MRLFNENTAHFIQSLASAIGKDPASMESWRCLHITQTEDVPFIWIAGLLQHMKELHSDMDCDIVHCADNDALFITRDLSDAQLYAIADEFIHAASTSSGQKKETFLYDLFNDWRSLRDLLASKATTPKITTSKPAGYQFGDIEALQEVFAEAKKLRKARLPLHVMVVEDDPLTRRLVTSAFKQKYALLTAANAEEAVSNYLLHAPDIVFLDIGLPDASGFEVLHRIIETDPDAYVVMFSANNYLDNITSALESGASGFIGKPFKKEKMRYYIEDSALHHHKSA